MAKLQLNQLVTVSNNSRLTAEVLNALNTLPEKDIRLFEQWLHLVKSHQDTNSSRFKFR